MDQIHMSQWQDTGLCNANQVRVEIYKGGETPGYKKTEDGVKDPNVQILLIYQEKIQKKKKEPSLLTSSSCSKPLEEATTLHAQSRTKMAGNPDPRLSQYYFSFLFGKLLQP